MARHPETSNAPRSIGSLMGDTGSGLGKLLQRARAISELGGRVSRLLESGLASHCRVANIRDGKLVFVCSSAAWATHLRMHAPALLESLRAAGVEDITAIEIKTRPMD